MHKTEQELRTAIERNLKQGPWGEARAQLETLWRELPQTNTAKYVISCFDRMKATLPLTNCKVAMLRSFTIEPLFPILRARCLLAGDVDLTIRVGEFNAYAQEILSERSWLYEFQPAVVILAIQTRDIAPELWYSYAEISEAEESDVVVRVIEEVITLVNCLRRNCSASILLHMLEQPAFPRWGILDGMRPRSQADAILRINGRLREVCRKLPGVYAFEYDALVARHGRLGWHDERRWLTTRLSIAANHLKDLAEEWTRYLLPLAGKTAKVVVTDLDNTLWQGVIGEDGLDGIRMDQEYPGGMFRNVQRVLLDLYHRGILLAISSKNNEADALEALDRHSDALLRSRHFAAIRCNWLDKAQNLREIARELNVGLESLVFLDDNPRERELIRIQLPEVKVIELPSHPIGYAQAVQEHPMLQRLYLSQEDHERPRYYSQQRQRDDLKRQSRSLDDFFSCLQQVVEIRRVTPLTASRVAQLTQKTNQFNLTTKRYTEAEILGLLSDGERELYEVRVQDRFGDNGIVGVCITRTDDACCCIEVFLLSCRVIGRTIETAMLAFLEEQCISSKISVLQGWYLPTNKNHPASNFYHSHGFKTVSNSNKGSLWELSLPSSTISCPSWITLIYHPESSGREAVHSAESPSDVVCRHI